MGKKGNIVASPTYFFIDGVLHRKIKLLPGENLLVAINKDTAERVGYAYSAVKPRIEKAWATSAVAAMMGRSKVNVKRIAIEGGIKIDGAVYDDNGLPRGYYFSEQNIKDMHEHLRTAKGTMMPTKDGLWTKVYHLPSRQQLYTMMNTGTISYVKDKNGEFIPAFIAPQ